MLKSYTRTHTYACMHLMWMLTKAFKIKFHQITAKITIMVNIMWVAEINVGR